MKIRLIPFFYFLTLLSLVAQNQIIPLYEGSEDSTTQPGETVMYDVSVEYNITRPSLTVYPAKGLNTGTAVIIAPGGGYFFLATDHEGSKVAEWLSERGVTAFVLRYRVMQTKDLKNEVQKAFSDLAVLEKTVAPVIDLAGKDGIKAVEYVRANAEEFNINPNRIGFMGFSAGGGVTMSVAFGAVEENLPNFIAPIYAYLPESLRNLPAPSKEMPAFIVVAADDEMRLAPVSFDIYSSWITAGQPAELHAYERGGHGFGMHQQQLPTDDWIERFGEWLASRGLLWPENPTGWAATSSYASRQEWLDKQTELMKKDWPNLQRYAEANKKLASPTPDENRVVFMGNSITEGWENVHPEFFKGKPYINRGIGGQTTPQMLARFRQDVVNLNPEVVVILGGTNDIAQNTGPISLDDIFENIVSMTELARANDINVVLSSVLPAFDYPWSPGFSPNDQIPKLNAMIKEYALRNQIVYLDYFSAMNNGRNGLKEEHSRDGVHPTLEGYKVMEPLVEAAIQKALNQK